jgi:endonuclease I
MGIPSSLCSRGKIHAVIFYSCATAFLWALMAIPSFAEPPAGYYASTEGKSGGDLKQALHSIIRGHTVIPYSQLDQPLADIWRDPQNAANISLVYSSTSIPASATSWNREHLWPRLRGNTDQSGPDDSDLFHVVPTDIQVNAERGNLPFDFSNSSDPSYRIPAHSFAPQCSRDSDSWQPAPNERGDIARAMFYMDVRYNGSENNTTDLELVSLPPTGSQMGNLNTLLLWHAEDPPDDAERARNDLIHSRYQGNRNPFIDHPEFAESIWGSGVPGDSTNNPLARVEALSGTASESPATQGRFLVSLNQFAAASGVSVFFQMEGAAALDEYSLSGPGVSHDPATGRGSVRIEPGFSQAVVALVPVDDAVAENPEDAVMRLTGGEGCDITPDASSRATIVIRDAPGMPVKWSFEEGTPYPQSLPSNIGEGILSFAGWRGQTNSFGGSTGKSLALVGNSGNGSWIEFQFSMRGWRDLVLEFKTRGTSAGYNTGNWSFSTNGVDFTTLPGVNTASRDSGFVPRRVEFGGFPQLNNAASVTLRYKLSGATMSDGNNRIDELSLSATAYAGSETPLAVSLLNFRSRSSSASNQAPATPPPRPTPR